MSKLEDKKAKVKAVKESAVSANKVTAPTLKKKKFDFTWILKLLCIALMVAYVVCMFLPYWGFETYSKEDRRQMILYPDKATPEKQYTEISVADYLWFTEDNETLFLGLDKFNDGTVYNAWKGEPVKQNDIVGMPFVGTLLALFATVFFLLKKSSIWPSLMALIAGGYSTFMLMTDPAGVYKPWKGTAATFVGKTPFGIELGDLSPFEAGISYNIWLIASIALTVGAFVLFVLWLIRVIKWFTVKEIKY